MTPEARRKAQEEADREHREWRELQAKVALIKKGERAYCATCGGELRLSMRPDGPDIIEEVKCDEECTHVLWRTRP